MFKKWFGRGKSKQPSEELKNKIADRRRRLNRMSSALYGRQSRIMVLNKKLKVLLPAVKLQKEIVAKELEKTEPDIKKINGAETVLSEALYEFEHGLENLRKYKKNASRYADAKPTLDSLTKLLQTAIQTAKLDLEWIRSVRRNRGLY